MHTSLRFGILCAALGAVTGSATGLVAGHSAGAWIRSSLARHFESTSAPPAPPPPGTEAPPAGPPEDSVRLGPARRGPDRQEPTTSYAPPASSVASTSSTPADATTSADLDASVAATDCPPDGAPPSPEVFHAFDRARAAIDHGVSRGVWSPGDREALRKDLTMLPLETRNEIERPLVVAIRQGRVQFHGRGPLF